MFDVLVYLYENYWRPDACPDHDQLTRKLSVSGVYASKGARAAIESAGGSIQVPEAKAAEGKKAKRLKARGLIADVRGDINGYIPGRAAATIPVDEVLSAFRSTEIELAEGITSPALQDLAQDLDESRKRRIAGMTIADLMPAPDGKPREEAVPLTIVPPGGTD